MAKNAVNYDTVDEAIREMQRTAENLHIATGICINKTDALLESSNAIFLNTVNDINKKLLDCDAKCVENIEAVYRAYKKYEEDHRALAEHL